MKRVLVVDDDSTACMAIEISLERHGFESIRIFHERAPTIPLNAMSGYAFANDDSPTPDFPRMALELGAARCLRKPFTPGALLAVINECLAEARSRFADVVQSNWNMSRKSGAGSPAEQTQCACRMIQLG